ncbi:MAG: SIR2 family NAD-dependent protein deacylase [Candidatus Bipolaricaulaceae bacterium]
MIRRGGGGDKLRLQPARPVEHTASVGSGPAAVRAVAHLVRAAERAWALTGAGVSTPSGIADFRGPHGLWQQADPERVSSIQGSYADPAGFYGFWIQRFQAMRAAGPNPVHGLLAWLEERGWLQGVITQNVDGLHQKAGSRTVLEIHGHVRSGTCLGCGRAHPFDWIAGRVRQQGVARCRCGGLVKPDVVLFGEELSPDFQRAERAIDAADLLVVLGTSLTVWPAAGLVPRAVAQGARLAIANHEPTPYDDQADVVLRGELLQTAHALRRLLEVGDAGG